MARPARILSAPTLGRALAEVAIIVVGVLIALGADAWWTERQEQALLQEYLERLAEDLDADRSNMERSAESEDRRTAFADQLIDRMTTPTEPPKDSLRRMINTIRGGALYPLRTGTWRDLSSTGRLALIEDPELRRWILRYYDTLEPTGRRSIETYEGFHESLYRSMLPHLDDRAVFGHLSGDPLVPVLATSWDAFRTDAEVGAQLRALSAIAVDEARTRRDLLRTIDCFRLALHDGGARWEVEPDRLREVRERCEA